MNTDKEVKQRTDAQNRALWKYFELLADELNSAGYDMKKVLKPNVDIPWSKQTICDYVWKPIMKAQIGLESTTEMTTKDIDQIYDTINRHIGEKFGLHVDFPSIESLMMNDRITT